MVTFLQIILKPAQAGSKRLTIASYLWSIKEENVAPFFRILSEAKPPPTYHAQPEQWLQGVMLRIRRWWRVGHNAFKLPHVSFPSETKHVTFTQIMNVNTASLNMLMMCDVYANRELCKCTLRVWQAGWTSYHCIQTRCSDCTNV